MINCIAHHSLTTREIIQEKGLKRCTVLPRLPFFVHRRVFVCLKDAVRSSLLKCRKCNISVWQRFLVHVFHTCTWSQLVARFLLIAQLYRLFLFIMICCVYTRSNKQIICLKYHLHAKKPNKKRNPQRGGMHQLV